MKLGQTQVIITLREHVSTMNIGLTFRTVLIANVRVNISYFIVTLNKLTRQKNKFQTI